MATQTLDSKKSAWGASGYTSTSDFKVGKTGDGTIYKGRLTFGPLPSGIIITSIKLTMNRIDSYNSHTLKFGVSKSDAWGAQTDDAVNVMVKSGKGSKNLNLSGLARTLAGYTSGNWYMHVTHGSGSNSYSEFSGGNDPTLTVTYEYASSKPTFDKSSVDMGSAVTIKTNRKSSALTHTIQYSFGAESGIIGTEKGVGDSVTWTPPLSLASQIPNSASGNATITCTTYLDGVKTGESSANLTLRVPENVAPSISAVNISEATDGLSVKFGAYIQGKSRLRIETSASGAQGSSIESCSVNAGGAVYSGQNITTGILTAAGDLNIAATVTDSRGRSASAQQSVSVLGYTAPYITAFTAERCNAEGTARQANGTRVWITLKAGSSKLNGKNDTTVKVFYKENTASDWIHVESIVPNAGDSTYVVDQTNRALPEAVVFSVEKGYDLRVEVTDYFGTSTMQAKIPGSGGLAYWDASRNRIGFGAEAGSDNTVQVNPDWSFKAGKIDASGAEVSGDITVRGRYFIMNAPNPYVGFLNADSGDQISLHYYGDESGKNTFGFHDEKHQRHLLLIHQDSGELELYKPLPLYSGGTGASSALDALINLGITDAEVMDFLATSAGDWEGQVKEHILNKLQDRRIFVFNAGWSGVQYGTGIAWKTNNTVFVIIRNQNATGGVKFWQHQNNAWSNAPVDIQCGGTGASNAAQARANLGITGNGVIWEQGKITSASAGENKVSFSNAHSGAPTTVLAFQNSGTNMSGYKITGLSKTGFTLTSELKDVSWVWTALWLS